MEVGLATQERPETTGPYISPGILRYALLAALAALALFGVYLLQIRDQPFVRHLVANPLVYDDEAHRMLDGLPRTQPFFLSPLYPAFAALVFALGRGSRLVLLAVQGVLLAINVGLLGITTSRILSRPVAVAAMLGMTLYWSFYYFAGEILPPTLCLTFLLAGWLLFTTPAGAHLHPVAPATLVFAGLITLVYALPALTHLGNLLRGRAMAAPSDAYWGALMMPLVFVPATLVLLFAALRIGQLKRHVNLLASGLALGFSMLIWSGVSLVAGLFTLSLLIGRGARGVRIALFVLGLGVPIAASLGHNYLISGDLIPITSSFGVNLFIGNNPASDGMDPFKLGEANQVRIEADRQGLDGARRSAFFAEQAMSFMRNHPREWLALVGKKALASVSRFNVDNNADMSERRDAWKWLFVPVLHFGIVFPLGIAGIGYCLRDKRRAYTLVLGFVGSMAVGIVFFVAERFRLPATAFLLPLAACGLFGLLGDVLTGRWRSLAVGAIVVIGGYALSNIDFLGLSDIEFASIIVNKAHVMRLEGDLEHARDLLDLAFEKEPENAGAYFQLGAIEEARGNQAMAMSFYLDSLDRDPFFYASYNRAMIILETNHLSTSYIDGYISAVLGGKPHDDLHRNMVEYVRSRTEH
jgi:hypothetical protein